MEERKKAYERRQSSIKTKCSKCNNISYDRCNSCIIGKRLRWLEAEYSDVTGWSHERWGK